MHHNTLLSQCIFISRWFPTGKQEAKPISIFQRQLTVSIYPMQLLRGAQHDIMRLQGQNKRSVFHHRGHVLLFSRYVWKSTDWGDCQVASLLSQQDRRLNNVSVLCGGGIQTRQLYCVQVPENSTPHHRKEGKDQRLNDSKLQWCG